MNKSTSKRHHYIPQFFTKGFTNQNGMIYVYNIKNDTILSNLRPPKSVFYEFERNTIIGKESEKSSFLEDVWYKSLDDKTSISVKKLQNEIITKALLNNDNLAQVHFFIISLFWRVPHTDFAVKDLIERAKITMKGNVTEDEIKKDDGWNKILRSRLYAETVNQCLEIKRNSENYYSQLSEFEDDIFIIGDNPIIFEKHMGKFTDFGTTPYCIALSSNRILSHAFEPISNFKKVSALIYNALIIDQSRFCVASSNLKTLQDSIDIYKKIKSENLLFAFKKKLFHPEE